MWGWKMKDVKSTEGVKSIWNGWEELKDECRRRKVKKDLIDKFESILIAERQRSFDTIQSKSVIDSHQSKSDGLGIKDNPSKVVDDTNSQIEKELNKDYALDKSEESNAK